MLAKKWGGDGYTAKLLGAWNCVEDINFDLLNPPYVLKSNCSGDGSNIAVIKYRSEVTLELKLKMKQWLNWKNTFINSSSNAYWKIKPQILAEEYLEDVSGRLIDYKFFCFDGKPYCIYTSVNHFIGKGLFTFYDTSWNVINVRYGEKDSSPLEKPKHFEEMIRLASVLSEGFPFVRVDFYDLPDRVVVGELTYDSSFGLKGFEPKSFDCELGEKFILPKRI